jgi:hypothetical protein
LENKKISFIKRLKRAIFNVELYADFATEKISIAIKFFVKLVLILSVVLGVVYTYKVLTILNNQQELDILYSQLQTQNVMNSNDINQSIDVLKQNSNSYIAIAVTFALVIFIQFLGFGFWDIIILSVFAIIVTMMSRMKIKYKALFIISLYALTLSTILKYIYAIANVLTNINVEYFSIAYDVISYIYIIAAILIIKSDFISQTIELNRIYKEQEKIREELKEQDNPDEKTEREKDKADKDEEKKEKSKTSQEPEPEAGKA